MCMGGRKKSAEGVFTHLNMQQKNASIPVFFFPKPVYLLKAITAAGKSVNPPSGTWSGCTLFDRKPAVLPFSHPIHFVLPHQYNLKSLRTVQSSAPLHLPVVGWENKAQNASPVVSERNIPATVLPDSRWISPGELAQFSLGIIFVISCDTWKGLPLIHWSCLFKNIRFMVYWFQQTCYCVWLSRQISARRIPAPCWSRWSLQQHSLINNKCQQILGTLLTTIYTLVPKCQIIVQNWARI